MKSGFPLNDMFLQVRVNDDKFTAVVEHYYTERVLGRGEGKTDAEAIGKAILVTQRNIKSDPIIMEDVGE